MDSSTANNAKLETERRFFDIYSGILFNNADFAPGDSAEITYDFDCPEYRTLIEKYGIDKIAGEGTAYERASRLLHYLSPRLTHKSDYDNHIPCNSLSLLEYSLKQPEHGINCVNKAKILTECCLALGIYARRVFIMPYSPYDFDNHVVSEIYDPALGKWIMLDPTADTFAMDEDRVPLSILELRERYAFQKYATILRTTDSTEDLEALRDLNAEQNTYICKNLCYLRVDQYNGFGRGDGALYFAPIGLRYNRLSIANASYRLRFLTAEHQRYYQEQIDRLTAQPELKPHDVSILTAIPH